LFVFVSYAEEAPVLLFRALRPCFPEPAQSARRRLRDDRQSARSFEKKDASNLSMFGLSADASVNRQIETAVHALMLDPLTADVCSPDEIRAMTLEMFKAQKNFVPDDK